MSVDLGDRTEDSIIYFMWSTNAADGSSITRATDGTISVYKNDNLTQSVAGIIDTEDFDSVTGIHMCKIDTSADAFYASAEDYTVVLSGATIDGKSVNAVLAVFSIENRFVRGTDSAAIEANVEGHVNTSLSAYNSPTHTEMTSAFTEIKGATWEGTDTLEAIRDVGDVVDAIVDRILDVTEIRRGTVASIGATTTKFVSSLTEPENAYWDRMAVLFTSGNDDGQMRRIKLYNGATKEITLQTPLDTAPANGDTFVIPAIRSFLTPDYEDIADAVLDELMAGHIDTGSLGKAVADILVDTDDLQGNQSNWTTATSVEVSDKTGFSLSDAGIDSILDETIEGTHSMRELMRLFASMLVGKVSGGGSETITFRDIDDTKNRIVMTVTSVGNRTGVSLTEE